MKKSKERIEFNRPSKDPCGQMLMANPQIRIHTTHVYVVDSAYIN